MGSWYSKIQKCKQPTLGYGFQMSLLNLSYIPSFQQQYKNSTYTKIKNDKEELIQDENIRKSQFAFVDQPKLSEATQPLLKKYLDYTKTDQILENTDTKWRIIKYQNGHFEKHQDKYIQKQGLIHIGTQILLPPKSLCSYQGGILFIIQNGYTQGFKPDETKWTHVIIPLGIYHQIMKAHGTRISYTKQIYIKTNPDHDYRIPQKAPGRQSIFYN